MRRLSYVHVDVFTDRPFGGNPLTVFLDATSLSAPEMQAIAKEMNHSETTFLFPPARGGAAKVRIFTPAVEIPFAGHPVVGTAFVIASERGTSDELVLELPDFDVKATLGGGEAARFVWMTQKPPEHGKIVGDVDRIARAIGIGRGDIHGTSRVWSTGIPFLFVPLSGLTPLGRIRPNLQVLIELLHEAGAKGLYAVTRETTQASASVRGRCFPVGVGVAEDAATGSAAGALAGFLLENAWTRPGRIEIEQGFELGRPSSISLEIGAPGSPVRVGGRVVPVGRGEIVLA